MNCADSSQRSGGIVAMLIVSKNVPILDFPISKAGVWCEIAKAGFVSFIFPLVGEMRYEPTKRQMRSCFNQEVTGYTAIVTLTSTALGDECFHEVDVWHFLRVYSTYFHIGFITCDGLFYGWFQNVVVAQASQNNDFDYEVSLEFYTKYISKPVESKNSELMQVIIKGWIDPINLVDTNYQMSTCETMLFLDLRNTNNLIIDLPEQSIANPVQVFNYYNTPNRTVTFRAPAGYSVNGASQVTLSNFTQNQFTLYSLTSNFHTNMGYPTSHIPLNEQLIRAEGVTAQLWGPQNAPLSAGQALTLFIKTSSLAFANPALAISGSSPYNIGTTATPSTENIGLIVCTIDGAFGAATSVPIGWINTSANSGTGIQGFAPNISSGTRRTRYRFINKTSQEQVYQNSTVLSEFTTTALNYYPAVGSVVVTAGGTAGTDYASNGTSQSGNLKIGQLVDPTILQDDYIEFERWQIAANSTYYWTEVDGMNYQAN